MHPDKLLTTRMRPISRKEGTGVGSGFRIRQTGVLKGHRCVTVSSMGEATDAKSEPDGQPGPGNSGRQGGFLLQYGGFSANTPIPFYSYA